MPDNIDHIFGIIIILIDTVFIYLNVQKNLEIDNCQSTDCKIFDTVLTKKVLTQTKVLHIH